MSAHQLFADSLLAEQPACPPGLTAWNQSDPGRRFAVYRNNVMVSLIDALADTYPVTQALVGEEFFRAMAGVFARSRPPRSPVMAHYGEGFAGFIEDFQPAAGLPYLADVARLELLRVQAYHAADAAAVPAEEIALLLADAGRLAQARFSFSPVVANSGFAPRRRLALGGASGRGHRCCAGRSGFRPAGIRPDRPRRAGRGNLPHRGE